MLECNVAPSLAPPSWKKNGGRGSGACTPNPGRPLNSGAHIKQVKLGLLKKAQCCTKWTLMFTVWRKRLTHHFYPDQLEERIFLDHQLKLFSWIPSQKSNNIYLNTCIQNNGPIETDPPPLEHHIFCCVDISLKVSEETGGRDLKPGCVDSRLSECCKRLILLSRYIKWIEALLWEEIWKQNDMWHISTTLPVSLLLFASATYFPSLCTVSSLVE